MRSLLQAAGKFLHLVEAAGTSLSFQRGSLLHGQRWFTVQQQLQDGLYTSPSAWPGAAVNICIQQRPGRGRGVVATRSLAAGELLLVAEPAAILTGPLDNPPDADTLPPLLAQAAHQSPSIAAALHGLFLGTASSAESLPDLQQLAACSSSSSWNSPSGGAEAAPTLPVAQAAAAVRWNGFSDSYDDLAAAAAAGRAASSQVGVWPAFSQFNHSCDPSAVHYVVGDRMVVRAAHDIHQGEEVTVCYMGREQFAPLEARQAVLQERYAFTCTCPRCSSESLVPPAVQGAVAEAYVTTMQILKPAVESAIEAADEGRLRELHIELLQLSGRIQTLLKQPLVAAAAPVMTQRQRRAEELLGGPLAASQLQQLDSSVQTYLPAGLYDLYELLFMCQTLLGAENESERLHGLLLALSDCFQPVSWVGRGDELHVFLACQLLQVSEQLRGADSGPAELARELLQSALAVRYGTSLSPAFQQQLLEASKLLAEEFLPCS